MCGIIGSNKYSITRNTLNKLSHRGPDERGLLSSYGDLDLGHTRLSIIGIEDGQQPMQLDKESISLTFNGEIYNYIELQDKLREVGRDTNTSSDTEVLLEYYSVFGIDRLLEDVNGMFAFVIHDKLHDTMLLVRDRLGIKPLFYAVENDGISFCSEITPLKDMLGIENLTIDPVAVSMYFNTFYIASPNTIWNEVRSLEPGQMLTYDLNTGKNELKTYWSLTPQPRDNHSLDEFDDLLKDAVRLRMRSDVPYGAYLSGGIDSSLVVKHMSSIANKCDTFTAEIKDKELNEKQYADKVAEAYNTNHTNIEVEYGKIKLSFLRKLARIFGQPFADSSIIPTYLISKKISESVAVALGGDGSDENFCGYNKYDHTDKSIQEKFFRNQDLSFLNDKYINNTYDYMISKLPYQVEDPQEKMRLMDIRFFLEGDILQKVDRLSMANSLEVRVPFLDHRILEYANRLDYDLLFGQLRKEVPKTILERDFDADFVHRDKIGFMLNVDEWIHEFDSVINQTKMLQSDLFRVIFNIENIENSYLKFAILMFVLWYEENYE
jgi:asparagine synthase (glutamine-hydrolysing)